MASDVHPTEPERRAGYGFVMGHVEGIAFKCWHGKEIRRIKERTALRIRALTLSIMEHRFRASNGTVFESWPYAEFQASCCVR